tara:strand:- start:436 stop:705 length:270 start_codon:yes stop_codon:yes gene_type:complete
MGRKCAVILFISFWCGGCGLNQTQMRCLDQERYLDSGDIGLLTIPDDLDSPDQTNALQIPIDSGEAGAIAIFEVCTEEPPTFYEEGLPG